MLAQTKKICDKAITLSPLEKIELIETLFFSLDSEKERNRIDQLWAIEAEDRLKAYENEKQESISLKEVFEKIEKQRL